MGELIFFAVLVILSIIESAAKSRRRRKGGGPLPEMPPEIEPEAQWPPQRRRAERPASSVPPSYDDDASFDARVSADEARSLEAETSYDQAAAEAARRRREASSSESMIPADIWAEIEGLARQAKVEPPRRPPFPKPQPQQRRMPPATKPTAKPQPRTRPATPKKAPAPTVRRPDVEGTAQHPVHLSHAGYGTDPSTRAASVPEVLRPAAQASSADATAVRHQLRQGSHALRRALILHEVLGPPAASRPDRFEE